MRRGSSPERPTVTKHDGNVTPLVSIISPQEPHKAHNLIAHDTGGRQQRNHRHGNPPWRPANTRGRRRICCIIDGYGYILVAPAFVCRKYIVHLERCTTKEDNDAEEPGPDAENKSNKRRSGRKKKTHKKDIRACNNKVSKMLGYTRWMRDSIWKVGVERRID